MHNPVSNSTRISTTGLLGLKMHVSFQLVGQFKIIFPHFTGLQQGWVGGPWTEYFQNCDTDFISFIKRVSWGFRFQDTCVVKVEKLWLLCLAVEGENCLDLVILSLYQFLQLGSGSRSNCPPPLSGEDDAATVCKCSSEKLETVFTKQCWFEIEGGGNGHSYLF